MISSDPTRTLVLRSAGSELEAVFAPGAGMLCCSLRHEGNEVLARRAGISAYATRGETTGIPLLYPWANRLAGFNYQACGRAVSIARGSPLLAHDPNGLPIHGVIPGYLPWELTEAPSDASRLAAELRWEQADLLAVFPFPHSVRYEAHVERASLEVVTTIEADAGSSVPVSFGFHPYLTLPSERRAWRVELAVRERLALDERMIPTGERSRVHCEPFELGTSSWDNSFTADDPPARFSVADATRELCFEFVRGYAFAQIYAPAEQSFICFEPMTAPTNALASGSSLPILAQGGRFTAEFRVSVRRT